MRSAVGYVRVSTGKQERWGLGLEAQQAALIKFAEAEGFALVETMVETESGKTDDRPKLMAALDLARSTKGPSSWQSSIGSRATSTTFPA